jgi:hypothetical protein
MTKQLLTPRDKLNLSNGRREQLKPKLPKNWRKLVVAIAPEYDSLDGATLMQNVHQGRSNDDNLLDIWERIINDDKAQELVIKRRVTKALNRANIQTA